MEHDQNLGSFLKGMEPGGSVAKSKGCVCPKDQMNGHAGDQRLWCIRTDCPIHCVGHKE